MDSSRTKTLNNEKPIYNQDIICYLKNNNQGITKQKLKQKLFIKK